MLFRLLAGLVLLLSLTSPARAAFDVGDIICETTTTTGTGTVNLAGAVTNYVTFVSQIASGNTVPYHIRASDGKLETGIGTFTDATPDTLTRTADWSSDGSGAELTLPAGTHTVCLGPIAGSITHNPMVEDLDVNNATLFDATTTLEATFSFSEGSAGLYILDDGAAGPEFWLQHDSASSADGDIAGRVAVYAGADDERVGSIALEVDDGATTTEDTRWRFTTRTAGSDVEALTLLGDNATVSGDLTTTDDVISGDDVLLSNAGVINFNAGDCTLTEGSDTLTIAGTCTLVTEVLTPDGDATRNLGSTAASWNVAHLTTIELGADSDTTVARSAAGEATLEGDAIKHAGLQMIWIPAGAMRNSITNPASCGDAFDSGSQDLTFTTCAFDQGATEENAEFGIQFPKSWNESTITMEFVWTAGGGSAAQTVQWKIACTGFGNDDALNTAFPADVTVSDALIATTDLHITAATSAITVQNAAENDYVHCRIGRDTSVDDLGADVQLIGAKVYYTDNAATMSE